MMLYLVIQKLLQGPPLLNALIYGLPAGFEGLETPVAITVVRYNNDDSLELACSTLPYGITLIGIAEFDSDETQDLYAVRKLILKHHDKILAVYVLIIYSMTSFSDPGPS